MTEEEIHERQSNINRLDSNDFDNSFGIADLKEDSGPRFLYVLRKGNPVLLVFGIAFNVISVLVGANLELNFENAQVNSLTPQVIAVIIAGVGSVFIAKFVEEPLANRINLQKTRDAKVGLASPVFSSMLHIRNKLASIQADNVRDLRSVITFVNERLQDLNSLVQILNANLSLEESDLLRKKMRQQTGDNTRDFVYAHQNKVQLSTLTRQLAEENMESYQSSINSLRKQQEEINDHSEEIVSNVIESNVIESSSIK